MPFAAPAWHDATRPWTFTVRGRAYVARPLSAPRVARFLGALDGASVGASEALLRTFLREAFPRRLSMIWRGDPVEALLALPVRTRQGYLADFFEYQGIAAGAILAMVWSTRSLP